MLRTAYELSAGLLSFIVAIVIGWWFGRLADRWLGTTPWLMVTFSLLGVAAGALNVYRTVSGAMKPPASGSGSAGD
jgi:ATP synthase protein I